MDEVTGIGMTLTIHHDKATNMMLARNPNSKYVGLVTGLTGFDLDRFLDSRILHFRRDNEPESAYAQNYFQAARASTLYAANRFPLAVDNTVTFKNFLTEFSKEGSYLDKQGKTVASAEFRPRETQREVVVPSFLTESFNKILTRCGVKPIAIPKDAIPVEKDDFGVFYKAFYDNSSKPLEEVMDELRDHAQQVILLNNYGAKDRALSKAIEFYHKAEIAWLWDRGNHSRATNLFNGLVSCIQQDGKLSSGMPHGVMDLAAFCMDDAQFEAYVRYCRNVKIDVK